MDREQFDKDVDVLAYAIFDKAELEKYHPALISSALARMLFAVLLEISGDKTVVKDGIDKLIEGLNLLKKEVDGYRTPSI